MDCGIKKPPPPEYKSPKKPGYIRVKKKHENAICHATIVLDGFNIKII